MKGVFYAKLGKNIVLVLFAFVPIHSLVITDLLKKFLLREPQLQYFKVSGIHKAVMYFRQFWRYNPDQGKKKKKEQIGAGG